MKLLESNQIKMLLSCNYIGMSLTHPVAKILRATMWSQLNTRSHNKSKDTKCAVGALCPDLNNINSPHDKLWFDNMRWGGVKYPRFKRILILTTITCPAKMSTLLNWQNLPHVVYTWKAYVMTWWIFIVHNASQMKNVEEMLSSICLDLSYPFMKINAREILPSLIPST